MASTGLKIYLNKFLPGPHWGSLNYSAPQTPSCPLPKNTIHIHHRHLLLLLRPKADTHFTVQRRVEGWVMKLTNTCGNLRRSERLCHGCQRNELSASSPLNGHQLPRRPTHHHHHHHYHPTPQQQNSFFHKCLRKIITKSLDSVDTSAKLLHSKQYQNRGKRSKENVVKEHVITPPEPFYST